MAKRVGKMFPVTSSEDDCNSSKGLEGQNNSKWEDWLIDRYDAAY